MRFTPLVLLSGLLAACGAPVVDDAERATEAATFLPPPAPPVAPVLPAARYDLSRQTPEALFPERARQSVLYQRATSSGPVDVQYSYETCSLTAPDSLRLQNRATFAELGPIGAALNRTIATGGGSTCAAADCFLQVNTVHLGRTVTITGNNAIACDDAAVGGQGTCGLGMASITDASGSRPIGTYRGNVIAADVIRIDGEVAIGSLSLVLAAKTAIEFTPTGRIAGGATVLTPSGARGTTAPVLPVPPTACDFGGGACPSRQYSDIGAGGVGSAGAPSGSVVLIAPVVRTPMPVAPTPLNPYPPVYPGFVTLQGGAGGAGGEAGHGWCLGGDQACIASVTTRARAGGRGGAGGAGGNLIVIADQLVGVALEGNFGVNVPTGGAGGAGGAGTRLNRYDPFWNTTQTSAVGATGAAGAASNATAYRHDLPLAGNYFPLVHQVARRGAERRLINARFHGRSPVAADRTRAQNDLADAMDLYCSTYPAPLVAVVPVAPRSVPIVSGRPISYVTTAARAAHAAACSEIEERHERLLGGRNYFGFAPDFVMYLRPDVVKGYRDGLLDTFDGVRRQLTDAVDAENASDAVRNARIAVLSDQLGDNDRTIAEKAKAAEIAQQRYAALAEAAITKLAWYQNNNDEIDDLRARVERAGADVERHLQLRPEEPCDFWCQLADVFTFILQVARVIASTVSAIGSITDFISNLGDAFDMGRITDELKTAGKITLGLDGSPDFVSQMEVLSAFGKGMLEGVPSAKGTGLDKVAADVGKAVEGWKKVDFTDPAAPKLADHVRRIVRNSQRTQDDLRNVLQRLHIAVANVEALPAAQVVDRAAALGTLHHMIGLVEVQIELARANGRLFDEHLMALAEMSIAENEVLLAMLEADNARARNVRLECQLGRIAGAQCAGIAVVTAPAARLGLLRDEACRASRTINDSVLLFDYFYQRSRDYVLLRDRTMVVDPSRDFRRNLVDPVQRGAFARGSASSYNDDFLAALSPVRDGSVRGDICWPGQTCAGSGGVAYQSTVMNALMTRGRAEFAVNAECAPGQPDSRCNAGLSLEIARQRVANFDVRLVMAPEYRLGCTTVGGCASTTPASASVVSGGQYVVGYRHEELATFLWDDGTYRSFLFTQAYPRMACEIAKSYSTGSTVDCRDLLYFGGSATYAPAASTPLPVRTRNDVDTNLFGTSVRGQWTVDVTPTLAQLNGPAGDGCYAPDPADASRLALPDTCLPSICLSSCFEDSGALKASGDPTAPASCGCYGSNLALRPAAQLVGRAECVGQPATLSRLRADAPELCGGPTGASDLESMCKPYVSSGRDLRRFGDPACCTATGNRRTDLTSAQASVCLVGGWTSDDACTVPEPCLEICGPRCKAFKAALQGFSYSIHWRAE